MQLLIVEDERRVASFLERGLRAEGYAVAVARDGEEAVQLATGEPFDLIILDLRLPKKDGLTVLREIRQVKPTVPVLILTARDDLPSKVEGLNAGADDYLTKPFAVEELIARIRAHLRRQEERADLLQALGLETSPQVRMLLDRGDGEAWIQTARGGARVAVRTVRVDGAVAGAYLVARFTDALDRNRTAMVRLFLLVLLGTLVAAGAIGYGLAGRALASLRQIARTARLISREDLTRRIGYRGAHDEVGTLAATLDEMLERLEAAFAEQQQFLSDVSHELRTPMQVIKGHLEVLRRLPQTDPQEVRETLTLVLEEVDRMAKLTTQLLTLARARAAPARQPLVLRPFLEEILRKAQTLAPRRFALQADADIIVTVDRDALTQIMLNLLQNAVDNTSPEDGITIGAAADHHEFRLWVADTGRGIPPEAMDHLFDRFYRVGENGGSGLGLAIVDALARAHGGRVHARSRLGEGSTFEVILPRE